LSRPEPLAVVGIGCRFPRGDGPDAFFRLLERGESAVTEVPASRFDAAAIYDPDRESPGKSVSRWGAFLDDVRGFDWQAFAVSPREARQMDPQQRLLLEVAWEAFEDAGLPLEALEGARAGVYVGATWLEYAGLARRRLEQIDPYTVTGSHHLLFTANRLSHFFDLRGPSMAVDTGCAASLTALHYACQDLWRGETELALAGGVNLLLTPEGYVARSQAGILSPDGRCKVFDASANGFVPGEGAGLLVLKPLQRALEDADRVYALVLSTAMSHNGRTPWIQAVSAPAQEALVREALARAGVRPDEVDYVEAHGAGTAIGDPVEARALSAVFSPRPKERPLRVGSVKTNIGHLEAAGSVAHVIKVALSIHRDVIPPSLNLQTVNPEIPLEALGLEVPSSAAPWPRRDVPRTAGVTSLGLGGTNAHAVLRQAPPAPDGAAVCKGAFLLPLSARSPGALQKLAAAHLENVRARGADASWLARYCQAAARRRTAHPLRAAVAAPDAAGLAEKLAALSTAPAPAPASALASGPGKTLFVFSGQGAQRPGMALALAEVEPVVKASLAESDALLRTLAGWSLLELLAEPPERSRVDQSEYAQPAQVAVQLALYALWRSFGLEPDLVMGHSLGEISAAAAAGAFDLESALRLAVLRGKLMQRPEGAGRMAQIRLPAAQVQRALDAMGSAALVAAVNGPRTTVITGLPDPVEAAVVALEKEGAQCRRLNIAVAGHSAPMGALGEALARDASAWLRPQESRVPLLSTVTASRTSGAQLDGAYWGRQLRHHVAFADAFAAALSEGARLVVEVSPHPMLQEPMLEVAEQVKQPVDLVPTLRKQLDEPTAMLEAAGTAWARGAKVRWDAVYPGPAAHADLPIYRWERQPLWLPPAPAARDANAHPLLGEQVELASRPGAHVFSTTVSLEDLPFLADHQVQGSVVMPAAAYVEMAVQAGRAALGEGALEVRDLELRRPLVLEPKQPTGLQVSLSVQGEGRAEFQIHARTAATWSAVAQGTLHLGR